MSMLKKEKYISLTDSFVAYLLEKSSGRLPGEVVNQAKECLVDYIGVTSAGNIALRNQMLGYLENAQKGSVRIIGCDKTADAMSSTFVNAFGTHVLELDDGHRFGMIHLAAPVISAVLTVSQMRNVSWENMVRGIVMGYEAAARSAMAMQPEHKKRGFHTSGTCGTIGAAIGVAITYRYNAVQLKSTIAAACTGAAGLLEIQENGSELKPYNVAHAAISGLNAAYIGRTGLVGPDDILAGNRGFTKTLAKEPNVDELLKKTDYFEIQRIYRKPYAACRHCHSAIEAALTIRKAGIKPEDIKLIVVDTYRLAVNGHDHVDIRGTASAKLSIPYSVASAYILGSCGLEAFDENHVVDKRILELTAKVAVHENPEFTKLCSLKRIAEVHVYDNKDRKISKRIDFAKGDPENPMTREEIREKFFDLMEAAQRGENAKKILEALDNKDIGMLFDLI